MLFKIDLLLQVLHNELSQVRQLAIEVHLEQVTDPAEETKALFVGEVQDKH